MKTLIFCITLIVFAGFIQAQDTERQFQITELNEAKLNYNLVPLNDGNSFSVTILENYVGEFEKDPLAFMKNNFDVKAFISLVQRRGYDYYLVSFRSRKGELEAKFDEVGNLLDTNQKFENIFLPKDIRHQLYREYKGWKMVKNVHIANSMKGVVNKNLYFITMKNGKETKNLKIDAQIEIPNVIVSK